MSEGPPSNDKDVWYWYRSGVPTSGFLSEYVRGPYVPMGHGILPACRCRSRSATGVHVAYAP